MHFNLKCMDVHTSVTSFLSLSHSFFSSQVNTSDPDPGRIGEVFYRIPTVFDEAGSFEVNATSGNITVASRLDFDFRFVCIMHTCMYICVVLLYASQVRTCTCIYMYFLCHKFLYD